MRPLGRRRRAPRRLTERMAPTSRAPATAAAAAAALLLTLLAGLYATSAAADERRAESAWAWRCGAAGLCERVAAHGEAQASTLWPSLPLCRLTCGAAGALWPLPTGEEATALMSETLARECRVPPVANANASDPDAPLLVVQFCIDEPGLKGNAAFGCGGAHAGRPAGPVVTASVSAPTAFGARHALETLSQLAACDAAEGGAPPMRVVARARVVDAPVFAHRGLLLDTARHWLPERALRRTVDAMAAAKLNVLHWHATDSHSFPLLLPRVPQLARSRPVHSFRADSGTTYSSGAVARLAAYARARGVRLLVELDAPAHAGAGWEWGPAAGKGELALCVAAQPWRQSCIQPPCGQLNPVNPAVYDVLLDVYRDLLDALPADEQLHLGGDEVFIPCWNSSSEVLQWLQQNDRGRETNDFLRLWSDFHSLQLGALDRARALKGSNNVADNAPILWSSHLTNPKDIEQYVDSQRHLAEDLMALGYRIILTHKDAWYLDHGFWGHTSYYRWKTAYNARMPTVGRTSNQLLGGETAMWGELVDEQTLDGRVWPRAAAAAERLWSDPETDADAAEPRLLQMRERLVRRGVRAAAVTPEWCYLNEGQC
ncbi:Chitooligosaccharidolytic beta-N-acetylglucosaminidase [Gryllus bimaculatus]|nr:Chitooligosaccharidolytic beta-N-acetylglucosaminidase [Gryllus bimaculatus]